MDLTRNFQLLVLVSILFTYLGFAEANEKQLFYTDFSVIATPEFDQTLFTGKNKKYDEVFGDILKSELIKHPEDLSACVDIGFIGVTSNSTIHVRVVSSNKLSQNLLDAMNISLENSFCNVSSNHDEYEYCFSQRREVSIPYKFLRLRLVYSTSNSKARVAFVELKQLKKVLPKLTSACPKIGETKWAGNKKPVVTTDAMDLFNSFAPSAAQEGDYLYRIQIKPNLDEGYDHQSLNIVH